MQKQIVVDSSNSSSVVPSVHMHNFESISVTEVIIEPCQLFTCGDKIMCTCMFLVCTH